MGAEGKVYQFPLKNEPTGDETYNYTFQNGCSGKQLKKCIDTVGKKYGKEWKVY
jgi:hypothetical protein